MGYPVFYSDKIAKSIITNDSEVKTKIIKLLGEEAYSDNGEYNKLFVGKKVFNNKTLLSELNEIVHPAVRTYFKTWTNKQNTDLVFYESALIFETNSTASFDKIILVTAERDVKIKRLLNRDPHLTTAAIEKRMRNQWSDDQKIPQSNYIIHNNPNNLLIEQINEIIEDLKKGLKA